MNSLLYFNKNDKYFKGSKVTIVYHTIKLLEPPISNKDAKGNQYADIVDLFEKAGFSNVILVNTLEEAVQVSKEQAVSGDAVLLSPACASWGMFKNYEERGNIFKELVCKL